MKRPSASRLASAPSSADRSSGAPGHADQPRACSRDRCRRETAPAAVSVRVCARILIVPFGRPAIASRAVSLASRWMTAAPPSAFGNRMASGLPGNDGVEVGVDQAGVEPVDAHEQARARSRFAGVAFEKCPAPLARRRLAVRRDRILEVEDDARRRRSPSPCRASAAVGGNEEKRAHHFGRMMMKAWRWHSATSLPSCLYA